MVHNVVMSTLVVAALDQHHGGLVLGDKVAGDQEKVLQLGVGDLDRIWPAVITAR